MSYKNNIVKKPWGHEYLVYENEHVALWFLNILKNQRTSMHCHAGKTTGLMVIEGFAEVSFLSDKILLKNSEKVMIRKGLFHSTRALNGDLQIFEIETPVDKHDLVRLEDNYGRTGQPYEDASKELPKVEDCVWIEDPLPGESNYYSFQNQKISVHSLKSFDELEELCHASQAGLMFLRGGLLADYGVKVAGPGDIVSCDVLQRLMGVFKSISENTVVLVHRGVN
jgi:mannose-6-phosphate isomerase-like protein (cupin superfamily)